MKNQKPPNKADNLSGKAQTKQSPRMSRKAEEFFLNIQMNWWVGLALVLPATLSNLPMTPIGPPRLILLSVFMLAFLSYFFLLPNRPEQVILPNGATRMLGVFAALFLQIMIAASVSGINKQEGLYTTVELALTLLTTAFFSSTVIREKERLPRLFKALTLALIIQATAGILQFYELAFTNLPPESARPYGLMANRNLLASAMALLLPFPAYVAHTGTKRWKAISCVAVWLGTYGIIICQTRSVWLAVVIAILASTFLVLLLRKRLETLFVAKWLKSGAAFLAGVLLALALAMGLDKQGAMTVSLKARTTTTPLSTNDETVESSSIKTRLIFWRQCLEIIRDHPILGVGPGNWKVAVPNYGAEGLPNADGIVTRDRAHNVYLQIGSETGVFGLIAYLGIWGAVAVVCFKLVLKAGDNQQRLLGMVSLAGACVYAVDAVFSFPNESLAHGLLLAFIFGLAIGLHEATFGNASATATVIRLRPLYFLPLILFAIFSAYLGHARQNFEYHLKRANAYKKLNRPEQILAEAAAGRHPLVTLSPLGDPIELYSAFAYTSRGQLEQALATIQQAQRLNPWSVRVWNEMGTVYSKMQRWDDAIRCYREALRMASKFDVALKNLGLAYYNKGMLKESLDTLMKSDYQRDEFLRTLVKELKTKTVNSAVR